MKHENIVEKIAAAGAATTDQIRRIMGVSPQTTRNRILGMESSGVLRMVGTAAYRHGAGRPVQIWAPTPAACREIGAPQTQRRGRESVYRSLLRAEWIAEHPDEEFTIGLSNTRESLEAAGYRWPWSDNEGVIRAGLLLSIGDELRIIMPVMYREELDDLRDIHERIGVESTSIVAMCRASICSDLPQSNGGEGLTRDEWAARFNEIEDREQREKIRAVMRSLKDRPAGERMTIDGMQATDRSSGIDRVEVEIVDIRIG